MEFDLPSIATLVAAGIALGATLWSASIVKRHDRQQQARTVLLAPAELFAEAASTALAKLRYVTPPSSEADGGPSGHRNEPLLVGVSARRRRLGACGAAIDEVRSARARVRVVFHPGSAAAEYTRETLQQLRASLDAAERYYADYDLLDSAADRQEWRAGAGADARKTYKAHRWSAYQALDLFYIDTARRLESPTWDFRRISRAPGPKFWRAASGTLMADGVRITGDAHVRARSAAEALDKLHEAGLESTTPADTEVPSAVQRVLESTPVTSGLAVALWTRDDGEPVMLWLPKPPAPSIPLPGRRFRRFRSRSREAS